MVVGKKIHHDSGVAGSGEMRHTLQVGGCYLLLIVMAGNWGLDQCRSQAKRMSGLLQGLWARRQQG